MAHQKIRKAVIPCAGFGTRFLPMTKASPKEMLPVVDKPVIQYIVEELVEAGIEEVILITGSNKRAIEDHFDYNFELEEALKRSGKLEQYHEIRAISDLAKFVYIRQKEQLGNGHAILQAKEVIENEPFVVLWGDEISHAAPSRTRQMIESYHEYNNAKGGMVNVQLTTDLDAPHRYGIVTGERLSSEVTRIETLIEKPGNTAQSPYLAASGGYILPPSIFTALENVKPGKGGEIWLVDAMQVIMQHETFYAHELQNGHLYDCGNKLGYLKANVDLALLRPELAQEFRPYLKEVIKD